MTIKKFESINIVPFIDIMLVLLVIVLTTATFVAQGIIPVELPQAASQSKEKPKEPLRITIKADGAVYVNETLTAPDLLEKRFMAFDPKTPVEIHCDKQSPFKHFVHVVDLLKQYQFTNLGIAAAYE